jgi:hypothetical protein
MGKVQLELDEKLCEFVRQQQVFFVATAPTSPDGHLNLSPKGLDTLRILSPTSVAYLDLVGSGIETVAHLQENGRVVIMFCAFSGPPRIVRLHGRGQVVRPDDARFAELYGQFPNYAATRSIILVNLTRVSTSCGYGVPRYDFVGERSQLSDWAAQKGEDGVQAYIARENRQSIDGLPGIRASEDLL